MDGLFDTLGRDWQQLLDQRATRTSYAAWAQHHPVLAAHPDLASLIAALRLNRDPRDADAILAALAWLAPHDALASRVLLQAILPGLRSLAYNHFWLAPTDELEAAIVSTAWEHIRRYPITTRPRRIAANLLLDTAHHVRRDLRRNDVIPLELVSRQLPAPVPDPHPADELTAIISHALDTGYLTHDQADVVLRNRVLHQPIKDIAAELGYPPGTIRHRRHRAEIALRAAAHNAAAANRLERRHAS